MNHNNSLEIEPVGQDEGLVDGCIAFDGSRCIASGELATVAREARHWIETHKNAQVLIFDRLTSQVVEIDFRGTDDEVIARLKRSEQTGAATSDAAVKRGPGRPKLGVVAREITLLPRHWDWLDGQPGGASVTLRKLVEAAKRSDQGKDRVRRCQESVYRFMTVMAGNLPGFEEALRSFYRKNYDRFDEQIKAWPKDVRDHVKKLTALVMSAEVVSQ